MATCLFVEGDVLVGWCAADRVPSQKVEGREHLADCDEEAD